MELMTKPGLLALIVSVGVHREPLLPVKTGPILTLAGKLAMNSYLQEMTGDLSMYLTLTF